MSHARLPTGTTKRPGRYLVDQLPSESCAVIVYCQSTGLCMRLPARSLAQLSHDGYIAWLCIFPGSRSIKGCVCATRLAYNVRRRTIPCLELSIFFCIDRVRLHQSVPQRRLGVLSIYHQQLAILHWVSRRTFPIRLNVLCGAAR